jgi:tRNA (Thr-GGU) A37 N-methylase
MISTPGAKSNLIQIRPIGTIHSRVSEQQTGGFQEVETTIDLEPEYADFLKGLADYSHVTVLYWLSEQTQVLAATQPQGHPEVPYVGMFACR